MFKRLRALVYRNRFEDGMNEELRFHMQQYTEDLITSGMAEEEAQRRAKLEFGGLNTVKEECREARGLHLFDEMTRQVSYAARLLYKTPGFTATAILLLGLCLGANLTIFQVIDSILLRALPFPQPGQLVTVFNTYPKAGVDRDGSSLTNYYERRNHLRSFHSLGIYRYGEALTGEVGSAELEPVMQVSSDFFSTLEVGPVRGRAFSDSEMTYQTNQVAILSDAFWRQRFNADPNVIGREIRMDGAARKVVGVLPADFHFLSSKAGIYLPLASRLQDRGPLQRHSGGNVIHMIARLNDGVTVAQAQAEIDAQNSMLERDDPQAKMMADAGFRSLVVPLHADHVAAVRPTLLLLQAGVVALLLIGLVNLINLLLIRANGRTKELAVRRALGASGWYVVSEALVETTLLAFTGGLLGLAAAFGGVRLLMALGAGRLPLGSHIAFDGRLMLTGLTAAAGLSFALAIPAIWFNFSRQVGEGLQSEGRSGTTNQAAQTLRHCFIVAQIALSFVLLAGAGLLGQSLKRAMSVSPGFRADHIVTGQVPLDLANAERVTDALSRQPGISAAGFATNMPFSGNTGKSAAKVKGYVPHPGESPRGHYSYGVGGRYFEAMGFRLRAGRFLEESDSHRLPRVCVVDEDFARYYWPNGGSLGQLLFSGPEEANDSEAFRVVGVVASVKQAGLTEDTAQGAVYYPFAYHSDRNVFLAVRSSVAPEVIGQQVQRTLRGMSGGLPAMGLRSMDERIADSLVTRRSPALLAGIFSVIALLLTCVGTYGVLSYAVAQRRREIGVRMALGARPAQIGGHFLSVGLRLLAAGVTIGLAGAWAAGYAMQSVLFHVPAFNFGTLGATLAVMGVISLAACLLPSYRSTRVSPAEALCEQ